MGSDGLSLKNVVTKVMEFVDLIKFLEDTWDGVRRTRRRTPLITGRSSDDAAADYLSPDSDITRKTIQVLKYMELQRQRGVRQRNPADIGVCRYRVSLKSAPISGSISEYTDIGAYTPISAFGKNPDAAGTYWFILSQLEINFEMYILGTYHGPA
jgi:hypothetical protein